MTDAADRSAPRPITLAFIARATLTVLSLVAFGCALWLARDVVFIAFFAVLLAIFLSLLVDPLARRGIPRPLAVVLVLLLILAAGSALVAATWPVLREQGAVIREEVPRILDRIEAAAARQVDVLDGAAPAPAATATESPRWRARLREELSSLVSGALPLLNTALGLVTGIALVIASGAFLALEPGKYVDGLVRLVPRTRRARVREVLPLATRALRQWIKGTAVGMLLIATAATLGLTVIGVPAALALGLLAGLLEFVPYVGPAASFVPATAVALAASPQKALAVIALYGTIQFLESWLLVPLLMRGMVRLPPALTLLFQSFMAALFGFFGLLLAVPVLAFGKALVTELWVEAVADER